MRITYDRPDPVESFEVEFEDEDGYVFTEDLVLDPLGDGQWRLFESPIFCDEAAYGDVIEATVTGDGSLRFVRRVHASGLESDMFTPPAEFLASAAWARLRERIVAIGGMWELAFGGIVWLHVPHDGLQMAWEEMEDAQEEWRGDLEG